MSLKIGVIVGSSRKGSINRKLARALVRLAPPSLEFAWIAIDDLPMYNGDLEGNRPAEVNRFTREVAATRGILVVTPEHNRSITAVLKNAIDWGSKPNDSNVWRDKPAVITGTSPGGIGTAVAQQHLRQILAICGASVMGGEAYVQFKPDLIDDEGNVASEDTTKFLKSYIERFAAFAARLAD